MDLDYALRNDRPAPLTSASTIEQRAEFQLWEKSNRMSLSIMKLSIPAQIKGSITEREDARSFLNQLADRFTSNEKVETTTLLTKLVTMRYSGKGNIREYIMEMSNIATSLKALKLDMSESMLVHFVLMSLPARFTPFKISYNTQKEKWTLNELIAQCVQEEGRLKIETSESAHLASGSQSMSKKRKRINNKGKGKQTAGSGGNDHKEHKKQDKESTCFFCKKKGHMKKDCLKYANWRVKKGKLLNFVSSEVNLAIVPTDTW